VAADVATQDVRRFIVRQGMKVQHIDYDSIAEIYDLYVKADYDLPFFLSETKAVTSPIIELMAGTGRLSIPLIEAGATLTCVDSSSGMLAILLRKLKQRGLHADLHCADVCRLDLPARFELAILPFQTFMEIIGEENQRAALESVFKCLAPGGCFICTLHNPAIRRQQVDGLLRLVGQFPTESGTLVVSDSSKAGSRWFRASSFSNSLMVQGACWRNDCFR
jgi:SAM-dependent methyltransferase